VFVAAEAGMPWDSMNAKQRQNVSLGVGATVVIGLLYALGSWLKRTISRQNN